MHALTVATTDSQAQPRSATLIKLITRRLCQARRLKPGRHIEYVLVITKIEDDNGGPGETVVDYLLGRPHPSALRRMLESVINYRR